MLHQYTHTHPSNSTFHCFPKQINFHASSIRKTRTMRHASSVALHPGTRGALIPRHHSNVRIGMPVLRRNTVAVERRRALAVTCRTGKGQNPPTSLKGKCWDASGVLWRNAIAFERRRALSISGRGSLRAGRVSRAKATQRALAMIQAAVAAKAGHTNARERRCLIHRPAVEPLIVALHAEGATVVADVAAQHKHTRLGY
jgi:hypothetical protein